MEGGGGGGGGAAARSCLQEGLRLFIGLLEGCGVERKLRAERISISVTAEGEAVEGI